MHRVLTSISEGEFTKHEFCEWKALFMCFVSLPLFEVWEQGHASISNDQSSIQFHSDAIEEPFEFSKEPLVTL